MLEYRSMATADGRTTDGTHDALLARIQDGLADADRPFTRSRRCPCCGEPIRAGQRVTRIHGTSVHTRCASKRG